MSTTPDTPEPTFVEYPDLSEPEQRVVDIAIDLWAAAARLPKRSRSRVAGQLRLFGVSADRLWAELDDSKRTRREAGIEAGQ